MLPNTVCVLCCSCYLGNKLPGTRRRSIHEVKNISPREISRHYNNRLVMISALRRLISNYLQYDAANLIYLLTNLVI
jgi:hypothetical protein